MRRQSLSIASESRKETRSSCFGDTRRLGGDLKPSPCPTPLLDSTTVPFAPIDLEHGTEQFSQVPPQCNEAELQLLLHQEELMSGAVHLMETRETRITRGACILLSVVLFPAVCHLRERGKGTEQIRLSDGEQAALGAGGENKHGKILVSHLSAFLSAFGEKRSHAHEDQVERDKVARGRGEDYEPRAHQPVKLHISGTTRHGSQLDLPAAAELTTDWRTLNGVRSILSTSGMQSQPRDPLAVSERQIMRWPSRPLQMSSRSWHTQSGFPPAECWVCSGFSPAFFFRFGRCQERRWTLCL